MMILDNGQISSKEDRGYKSFVWMTINQSTTNKQLNAVAKLNNKPITHTTRVLPLQVPSWPTAPLPLSLIAAATSA